MDLEEFDFDKNNDLKSLVLSAERDLQDLVDGTCDSLTAKEGTSEESEHKKGRRSGKKQERNDMRAKLVLAERSRQSARECRARKKLRYQYLEELISSREKAIYELRKELEVYRQMAHDMDAGRTPEGLEKLLEEKKHARPQSRND